MSQLLNSLYSLENFPRPASSPILGKHNHSMVVISQFITVTSVELWEALKGLCFRGTAS